jgi:dTDP-3-amino-3,4,6-trideoxy-alpha-D-glucose transaminase
VALSRERVRRRSPLLATDGPLPLIRLDNDDRELLRAVERVVARNAFTLGDAVERFERQFAAYCETEYAVGVSSGTEALVLAMRAVGVDAGDEVIVPANSFIATAEAVTLAGATPRLVDVDLHTHLLTPEILERNIGPRSRCVIPVHLYGATVDIDPILSLARRAGLAVIEDACQAHGARLRGRRVGSLADCGCFSFYPTKNLGGWGDGGAVVTSDPAIAERVRLLRSHGEPPGERHRHRVSGTTARLDAIQAAVLEVKLRRLDERNDARRLLATRFTRALAETGVACPLMPVDGGDHVFHLYVVRTGDRDGLRAHLAGLGIHSAVHYPVPVHLTEAYAHLGMTRGDLPAVERLARDICSLPFFPDMSDTEIQRVAAAVASFNRRAEIVGVPSPS